MTAAPTTPDGRYFVVRGRLWRCADPSLPEDRRAALVKELMAARRAVGRAKREGVDGRADPDQMGAARRAVDAAKVALGERGPVWWTDGAPDYNRHMARNTPYAAWYEALNDGER
jgi:hypothetical protein